MFTRMRGIIAFISSIAMLVAFIGYPEPERSARLAGEDEDYPCKHHRCGCLTAEMCRTHCCCFPHVPKCCHASSKTHRITPSEPRPLTGVGLVIKSLSCSGAAWNWSALVIDVIGPAMECLQFLPQITELVRIPEISIDQITLEPSIPPPRLS